MLGMQHGDAGESSGIVILKGKVRFETCGNYPIPLPSGLHIESRGLGGAPATSRRGRKICFFPGNAAKTAMFSTQLGQDSIFVLPAENQTLFVLELI
jgi:hypothetical protein